MGSHLKRISLMVEEEQHRKIAENELNLSGFVRELIDDHFSDYKITLSVSEDARDLYQKIVSNTGATDIDIEPYFVEALKKMLKDRIRKLESLQKNIERK